MSFPVKRFLLYVLCCITLINEQLYAVEPRYRRIPHVGGWGLAEVVDVTSMGDVTGTTVALTSVGCSGFDNGGALTTDAGGNVICSDDNSAGAGSGDITDVNEGFAIDVTNSTGPAPS